MNEAPTYQLMVIGAGLPVTLTVSFPWEKLKAIALAGDVKLRNIDTPVETHTDIATRVDLSWEDGNWFLSVFPMGGGKIVVSGQHLATSGAQ